MDVLWAINYLMAEYSLLCLLRSRRGYDRRSVVVRFAPYYTTRCDLSVLCVLRHVDAFER